MKFGDRYFQDLFGVRGPNDSPRMRPREHAPSSVEIEAARALLRPLEPADRSREQN